MKFAICLIGYFFVMILSIWIMIYGWGLQPQSWGWVVFGYLTTSIIGAIFSVVEK